MSIRINGKKYRNGTIVRANPVEEVTGTLEKIGIGSGVYEIQGGGGGSGGVYVEDELYTATDTSFTDITVDWNWDDYDFYIFWVHDNPYTQRCGDTTILTKKQIKHLVDNSMDNVFYRYDNNYVIYTFSSNQLITSSKNGNHVIIQIIGVKTSGNYYSPVIYSTEEREIGVWTDGKPLYQKTVIKSGTISQRETISLGIANVENIFLVSDASNVNNGRTPLPLVTGTDNNNNTGGFFDIQQSDTSFLFRIGSGMAGYVENATITVQYTKTTDVAGSGSYTTLGVPNVPIYTLSERVLGLNNYSLNLTHSDGTVITQAITSDDQIINFEITKPGIWTLSNTKDSYTKTYTINTTSDIFAGSIVSIIPILSNNTGSNGVAIAPSSSPNYGDGNAWWAFDNSFSTELEYLGEGQRNAYIGYIFNNDVYIDNLKAWMGNYSSSNDFSIQLQITLDGSTWTTVNTFKVAGYSDGTYGEFDYDLRQMVRGFRYYSSTLKNGGQNWKTYEIQAWGSEL